MSICQNGARVCVRLGLLGSLAASLLLSSSFADAAWISGTPPTTVSVGSTYSFHPASGDWDHDITFSIANKPSWMSFNSSTGHLWGVPTVGQVGTYRDIVIYVVDGSYRAHLPAFSITVLAVGSSTSGTGAGGSVPPSGPPSISGQPATSVNAGSTYSFKPNASDPAGLALTFSIQNKPAWASFSSQSGLLSGVPAVADVGVYSNIVISVSDGTSAAALPAFAVAVNQVSYGTATLSWTPPTQNTNGSALTNLGGYHIYYGTAATNLSHTVTVSNPGLATYVVSNLATGTWYFAIAAYNTAGAEGARSSMVSVVEP